MTYKLPTLRCKRPDRFPLVRSTDAEITYKSADGVLFRIHKINLEAFTEGLSPPEGSTFEEVVELTENSAILELLFQFIYPTSGPDLSSIDFNVLESLAEAAEKYQVYTAMSICKIHMMFVIDSSILSTSTVSRLLIHPCAGNYSQRRLCPFSRTQQNTIIPKS